MKTILIVDDTVDYAENIKFMLTRTGYNVIAAFNGVEGVEQAIQVRPDLILMDLLMPQQDGVETTIKIREQETLKDIPVIFLTAVTAGENVITSVNQQDYSTVSKLVDYEILLNKIREHLGN